MIFGRALMKSTLTLVLFCVLSVLPCQANGEVDACIRAITPQELAATDLQVLKNLQSQHRRYYEIGRNADGPIEAVRALGLDIPVFGEGPINKPSVEKIYRTIQARTDELVASGRVTEAQVIRPGHAIRNGKQFQVIPWRQTTPENWQSLGESNMVLGFVPFLKGLREGLFPLGLNAPSTRNMQDVLTIFEHDLHHFTLYLEYPEIAAALRAAATKTLNSQNEQDLANDNALYRRWYTVTESIAVVKPQFGQVALMFAGLNPTKKREPRPVQDFYKASLKWRRDDLLRIFEVLKAQRETVHIRLGGAARDPFTGAGNPNHDFLDSYYWAAQIHIHARDWDGNEIPPRLIQGRKALADLLCALYNFSLITAEEWIAQAATVHYDRNSLIGRLVCDMGLFRVPPRRRGEESEFSFSIFRQGFCGES